MTTSPDSPRRRHILSSINPDDGDEHARTEHVKRSPSRERRPMGMGEDQEGDSVRPGASRKRSRSHDREPKIREGEDVDNLQPRSSRIRLKSKSKSTSQRHRDREDTESRTHRRHHHRRHHRRSRSPTPPNPYEPSALDPDAAFRESLFDAMADDEGASYWQGVYGQPIHVYSNERPGSRGELERMTDEEYANHVRQKMWEKTHQGLLEERTRREEARKRKKEEEQTNRKLQEDMERSLRRGEERRKKRMWKTIWDDYTRGWSDWAGDVDTIPWPVESGRRKDIDEKEVRRFIVNGLAVEEIGEKEFAAKLREERVRWHPDKMQQKLGGQVDDSVMKDVTAIFQIIDKLWADTRSKA
ncbi:hypothetical protein C8035_v001723 [Colletotrichum spinosum]|uniref:NF-kappa-B inhibitor-like protein 1 n=1 Tax=Colletotrichum spinosum TaxID=1347390 RepID=A0A4R8QPY7_9PEZI|nr:hypothetical protein C8035_v001723 [Colletotrichum spinosum]